jgi:hypothetical protein
MGGGEDEDVVGVVQTGEGISSWLWCRGVIQLVAVEQQSRREDGQ